MDVLDNLASQSVAKIKEALKAIPLEDYPGMMDGLRADSRKAVQKLADKLGRDLQKQEMLKKKSVEMLALEASLRGEGYHNICGMDEVGRGPLAGPVVCAAVIMAPTSQILGVDDSKKLTKTMRESLDGQIKSEALAWSIGLKTPEEIDRINILEATKRAMGEAVEDLCLTPDLLLIDALDIPSPIPVKPVIHGDALCYSIAAASIIAKVFRDNLMMEYSERYPQYGFERNMGYGTAEHIEAIKKYGLTPIHRLSFVKNFQ